MSIKDKLKDRINNNYQKKDDFSMADKSFVLSVPEGVNFFKPHYDKINQIVILPYISGENDPKVKNEETYVLEYFVHRSVGVNNDSFLCLKRTYGKPCPICEQIELLRENYEENKDIISKLKASKRAVYNILDLNSDNHDEIKIFDASFAYFEKEMLEEVIDPNTKEIVCFPDTSEEGYIIKFRASEENFGKVKFPKYKSFRFEKREKSIKKEILDKVICLDNLLNIPTYEQVKNTFLGNNENTEIKDDYYKEVIKPEIKKQESKNICTYGHTFGKDVDAYNECIQCEIWEKCSENQ